MSEEKRIIEVNGVKMEIDLRQAKTVNHYKVGDHVKVLAKDYSDYKSFLGVIVGFDEFENLPTIVVAYLKTSYSIATIEFAYINSESKDVEICTVNEWDLPYSKSDIVEKMDSEIAKKKEEVREAEQRKNYFLNAFGKYFEQTK